MTEETQKLNVVVILSTACGSVLLGILGYRMMFGHRKSSISDFKEGEDLLKSQPKQTSVEPSKTEIVNDVELTTSDDVVKAKEGEKSVKEEKIDIPKDSTPEDVMKKICEIILTKTPYFDSKEEFLKEMIRMTWFSVLDPGWMDKAPRTLEECENMLKSYGLWELYLSKLKTNSKTTDCFQAPIIDREKSIRRIRKRHSRPKVVKV